MSVTTAQISPTKPHPVRTVGAVIATIAGIAGGLLAVPGIPDPGWLAPTIGVVLLVCTVLTATLLPALEARVVPLADTMTYLDAGRQPVAGPALKFDVTAPEADTADVGRHYDRDGDGLADGP